MASPFSFDAPVEPVVEVSDEALMDEVAAPEPAVEVARPVLARFPDDAGQPLYDDNSNLPQE